MAIILQLFKIVPKNLISNICGKIVSLRIPSPFQLLLNTCFVKLFNINMDEAEKDIKQYTSIQDVFTRRLALNTRKICPPFCSPCDGTLNHAAKFTGDHFLQVKKIHYSLSELLFGKEKSQNEVLQSGWYASIYLAPHNYHRVHSPISGVLCEIKHISGDLWPVNSLFLNLVPKLYTQNERLIFKIMTADNSAVYVVMIGAFNVGKIKSLVGEKISTNNNPISRKQDINHTVKFKTPIEIKCGDELGVFMLGSSVVLVCDNELTKKHNFLKRYKSKKLTLGEPLLLNNHKTHGDIL